MSTKTLIVACSFITGAALLAGPAAARAGGAVPLTGAFDNTGRRQRRPARQRLRVARGGGRRRHAAGEPVLGFGTDDARGFTPLPGDYTFGVCAAASADPVCQVSPSIELR
jgi:hypothetical protein